MLYPPAIWRPSPNFDRRSAKPDFVVIHITDGGPSFNRCVERFQDDETRMSPHFVAGRAGELAQLVDTADRAWHCSGWNTQSVGIEFVARTPNEFKKWPRLSETTRRALVADDSGDAWNSPTDPGMPVTEAQLVTGAALVAWLCRQYAWPADRHRIRPHCENPRSSHADCGRDVADGGIWPWAKFLEMVRSELR